MMGRVAVGEVKGANGTVYWDGVGTLRLRYDGTGDGFGKLESSLRDRLGERVVPVEAIRAVAVGSELRLVLRDGADPLQSVAGGHFDALIEPYRFTFDPDDRDLAERIAADIRIALSRRDVPETPAVRWLVAPPAAPDGLAGRDATLSVVGGALEFAYNESAGRKKRANGNALSVPLADITTVEWAPNRGRFDRGGFLRVSTARTPLERPQPKHDPAAMRTERETDGDALFFAARLLTRIRP
jgi:hypothetical protein